jgi:hypothetical protein
MGDRQCGLCLSCGAPFMPEIEEIDFFNREGNLSVLFLDTAFRRDPDIQRTYEVPKLCSKRQASHMVHLAYHQTALKYMMLRHTDDNDVGPPAFANNALAPNQQNAPFLYYHVHSGSKGPKAATWRKPTERQRMDFSLLEDFLVRNYQRAMRRTNVQLGRVYDICMGCNALMTQKSHMRFMLGCGGAGGKNMRGRIVQNNAWTEHPMDTRNATLENGYGLWRRGNQVGRQQPGLTKTDSEAPAIAYYLHLCLPFQAPARPNFFNQFAPRSTWVRRFYLHVSWLILEIGCLAMLVEEGTVSKKRAGKGSHGQHQHWGVLDLYVSYVMWEFVCFEFGNCGIDFVQWHPKFYCDARNCPEFLDPEDRGVITGRLMHRGTGIDCRLLLEDICESLVVYYERKFRYIGYLLNRQMEFVPPVVKSYFVSAGVARLLGARSMQVWKTRAGQ